VIFALGLAAAALLGAGWVIQQRVAIDSGSSEVFSWSQLMSLARSWWWWAGIGAMAVGQSLSAWALQWGAVSTVEPVLVTSLLFAFGISAVLADARIQWPEVVGTVILCVALAVFLGAGDPQVNRDSDPGWLAIAIAAAASAVAAALLWLLGRLTAKGLRHVAEPALFGAAAGVMYGLQDAATRGAIVATERHNVVVMFSTLWPWVLLGSATIGVLLSQSAFRTGRLDFALPPTAVTQPIAGIVIGICLLRDSLSATGWDLAFESLCVVGMIVGVAMISRSPTLAP
jgi:hypothetical protein